MGVNWLLLIAKHLHSIGVSYAISCHRGNFSNNTCYEEVFKYCHLSILTPHPNLTFVTKLCILYIPTFYVMKYWSQRTEIRIEKSLNK